MESQAVRRRINTISGHFGAGIVSEDVAAGTTHLLPLNCSSNLSTTFRRLDSRVHYGHQSSAAQGYFMRQALSSMEEGSPVQKPGFYSVNYINEEKVLESPLFSRPATIEPRFSRPAEAQFNCSGVGISEPLKQDKMLSSSECPKFARPGEEKQFSSSRPIFSSQNNGIGWSPRINVAESKSNHVISVELPGVDVSDIRVEMDDKNLIVKGKRSMNWWKAAGCSNDSFAAYHKHEISQGPYQVVWPLPAGANKDAVFAEFVEGILQITIPKL